MSRIYVWIEDYSKPRFKKKKKFDKAKIALKVRRGPEPLTTRVPNKTKQNTQRQKNRQARPNEKKINPTYPYQGGKPER